MIAIDATVGNGHDLFKIASLLLKDPKSQVYGYDIQKEALEKSQARLKEAFSEEEFSRIQWIHASHEAFPEDLEVDCVVYNLGYLPGGDKSVTTKTEKTLVSLKNALAILKPGGIVFVTCYPGHEEGALELEALLSWSETLNPGQFSSSHLAITNREKAPQVLIIQKATSLDIS